MGGGRKKRACFVAVLLFSVAVTGPGCTSLQPTELPLDELRHGIRNGSLVQPGDKVGVVVADGKQFVLVVHEVDEDDMRGESAGDEVTVAIDDVLALRTGRTDGVRTTFAVLSGIGVAGLVTLLFVGLLITGV